MLRCKPWYRKADGWWYCTLPVDGRQRQFRLLKGSAKKRDAKQAEDEARKLAARFDRHGGDSVTRFSALADEFLRCHVQEFSQTTYDWYWYYLERFRNFWDDSVALLTPHVARQWVHSNRWGKSSQRAAFTCLKRVLNWAVGEGLLTHSPLVGLKRPGVRCATITAEQHAAMLEEADAAFRPFLTGLRESGARPSELRNLTREMVDLRAGTWTLPQHKTLKRTGKPRVIFLSPVLLTLTEQLLADLPPGARHLFRNRFGKPWTMNAVRLRMKRLRQTLDLPSSVFAYAYRHTYATEALARGIAPQFVAELLGHSSLDMLSRYGHVDQRTDLLRQVAAQASPSVAGAPSGPYAGRGAPETPAPAPGSGGQQGTPPDSPR